jgi:transcriptional regulator with GAF, ATPase, and Fis domain
MTKNYKQIVKNFQREIIADAYKRANWVTAEAARSLELNRTTFLSICKRLGVKKL